MKELISQYLGEILTAIAGAMGMYFTNLVNKKKHTAEIEASELENHEKNMGIYQKMIDDLEDRFDKKHQENQKEIEELKKKLEETEAYWRKRYTALKRQFDEYKKTHP